jgi:hypothetical protein
MVDFEDYISLYSEFQNKWCRAYFEHGRKTTLKILKVSGDVLLCQNVRGTKKLINAYELRNIEEFSGTIRATGELVQNGLVVSKATQQVSGALTN